MLDVQGSSNHIGTTLYKQKSEAHVSMKQLLGPHPEHDGQSFSIARSLFNPSLRPFLLPLSPPAATQMPYT